MSRAPASVRREHCAAATMLMHTDLLFKATDYQHREPVDHIPSGLGGSLQLRRHAYVPTHTGPLISTAGNGTLVAPTRSERLPLRSSIPAAQPFHSGQGDLRKKAPTVCSRRSRGSSWDRRGPARGRLRSWLRFAKTDPAGRSYRRTVKSIANCREGPGRPPKAVGAVPKVDVM